MSPSDSVFADWIDLLSVAKVQLRELFDAQTEPTELPVFTESPSLRERMLERQPIPLSGQELAEIMRELRDVVAAGYLNGAHPQHFGYFHPRPLPIGVIGDAIAAMLNQSPAAWRAGPAATVLEMETLSWVADFIGYPADASGRRPGVFTSGGSTANLAALKLARDEAAIRHGKGWIPNSSQATVYVSTECHYSITRAIDILGLGRESLRCVPTDDQGRVAVPALRKAIADDIEDGHQPLAVVGLACATATGAVDSLADVAEERHLWFHVDGAAGAPYAGVSETRSLFAGLDRAHSVTLDPHKWLFMPYGIGCLLVRDSAALVQSFHGEAHYWAPDDDTDVDSVFMQVEGSRPWKSLGLWLALRQLGSRGYAELLARNLEVARHLAAVVDGTEGFELLAHPTVPVCCFRVLPLDQNGDADGFNERLRQVLVDSGRFYVTTCRPNGRVYLRAAINNFATELSHVEALVAALRQARKDVAATPFG